MMRRCNGSMMGTCSCGLFHHHHHTHTQTGNGSSAFSVFFSSGQSSNRQPVNYEYEDGENMYSFAASSSSVDCTLSLGTPSTRLSTENEKRGSGFRWDNIFQSNNKQPPASSAASKSSRGAAAADSLVARRCANCDTTSTPLWRNGPRGLKSLCNACGIRFKKEERRAAAATANGGAAMESQQMMMINSNNNSWVHHNYSQGPQKVSCYPSPYGGAGNEFRFTDNVDGGDSDAGVSFLSWRLNVADRPSLVHDFTR